MRSKWIYLLLNALVTVWGAPSVAETRSTTVPAERITVCPDCAIKSIREAIAAVASGGMVKVLAGNYYESELVIRKSLRLTGEGQPIIDAGGKGNVLLVNAPSVEISGLVLQNSGVDHLDDLAGIKIIESTGCRILNNDVRGNYFGISIAKSQGCLIEGNRIQGADRSKNATGNGIHIWYGEGMVVLDNDITATRDGIYFEFVKNSRIIKNRSIGNLRYGLHFMFSNDDEYRENIFENNESGVAVMYSRNIRMIGNRFAASRGAAAYGILLKDISASEIRGNQFIENTVGAYVEGTTRSTFIGNSFKSNGWALRVLGNTDSNRFEKNRFVSNTFDVATNASSNLNRFFGNYWDSYRGVDLNHDGFGDDAYRPVRLSSLLMEKFGASVLLLKSFFFSVVDEAERAFPVLTPATYQDDRPLMREGWAE